ncbi:Sensitive to high expression protein 9-like protein, mitochondrial [Frankliniella fusca]|uniref:Sensitive to high expression protein 9-like protein, mitochondrial n=1 Tax=Frankliniella fusca TaxID=407009 RepID=A0AAE1L6D9_9NEOP|nr:Sensitive to high expression protein 9-like protein, mitochondrial [Frankliniella fusca]
MTLSLGLRHGLSWAAQVDILKMMRTIFGSDGIPLSKNNFIKKLNAVQESDINYHVYCDVCNSYLGKRDKREKHCGVSKKVFVVGDCEVSELDKFKRQYIPRVYCDVYDGDVYKKVSAENGILSSPLNMSCNFFTGGVAYGKSTTVKTLWPIYLTINELPYEERQKYLILARVYAGAKDPSENWSLQPFVSEANKMSQNGFAWAYDGKPVVSLVIPLAFVADSVVRYQMLNGQTFHAKKEFLLDQVSYVPFLTDKPVRIRSKESHLLNVEESKKQQHHNDESLRHYRDNVVVDYMHAILRLVKKHMELINQPARKHFWLPSSAKSAMVDIISAVDLVISQIQSNTSVIRELRPLSDLVMWKASEWRSWLLIWYTLVCYGKATFLMLRKEVSHYHITYAMELFQNYICLFQKYFFDENMVYIAHLLTHISEGVFNFGPVWGHNSFLYESKNRRILALSESPYFLSYQIARKFVVFQSLPSLCNELGRSKKVMTFCDAVMNYKKLLKVSRSSDGNCVLLGTPVCHTLQENEFAVHLTQIIALPMNAYTTRKKGSLVKSMALTKKNDSFAFLEDGRCVQIVSIVKSPVINTVLLGVKYVKLSRKPLHQNDLYKFDTVK